MINELRDCHLIHADQSCFVCWCHQYPSCPAVFLHEPSHGVCRQSSPAASVNSPEAPNLSNDSTVYLQPSAETEKTKSWNHSVVSEDVVKYRLRSVVLIFLQSGFRAFKRIRAWKLGSHSTSDCRLNWRRTFFVCRTKSDRNRSTRDSQVIVWWKS